MSIALVTGKTARPLDSNASRQGRMVSINPATSNHRLDVCVEPCFVFNTPDVDRPFAKRTNTQWWPCRPALMHKTNVSTGAFPRDSPSTSSRQWGRCVDTALFLEQLDSVGVSSYCGSLELCNCRYPSSRILKARSTHTLLSCIYQ